MVSVDIHIQVRCTLAAGTCVSRYWHSSRRNTAVISRDADVLHAGLKLQESCAGDWGEGAATLVLQTNC